MINPWDNLEERLRAIANNKANGGCDGVALICVNLFFRTGQGLQGWYKPQRIQLEPRSFDVSGLIAGQRRLDGWKDALFRLENSIEDNRVDKTLVILDGKPVGFL